MSVSDGDGSGFEQPSQSSVEYQKLWKAVEKIANHMGVSLASDEDDEQGRGSDSEKPKKRRNGRQQAMLGTAKSDRPGLEYVLNNLHTCSNMIRRRVALLLAGWLVRYRYPSNYLSVVCCRFDAFPPDDEMRAYVLRYFSGDESFPGSIAALKRVLATAWRLISHKMAQHRSQLCKLLFIYFLYNNKPVAPFAR